MSKARILVCDDEAAARRGAVRALGMADYDFVECGDGRECLAVVERPRHGVDLILLDLRMPGMDGMTTLAHVTALPAPPPVVVVTADSTLRTAIKAVNAGAVDYLSKPYEIDELRFVVKKSLEMPASASRTAGSPTRCGGSAAGAGSSASRRPCCGSSTRSSGSPRPRPAC